MTTSRKKDKPSDDKPRFEDVLKSLEQSVQDLESGRLGLDDALKTYESSVNLLSQCKNLLDDAQRKVMLVTGVDEAGQPFGKAFEVASSAEEDAEQ